MRTAMIIAATAMSALWPAHALAIDVGVGGISASVDNGSVSAGATVGGASASVGASTGGISGGVSASTGTGAGSGGATSSVTSSSSTSASNTASASTSATASAGTSSAGPAGQSAERLVPTPPEARPFLWWLRGEGESPDTSGASDEATTPGTPDEMLSACRETVIQAARPYGMVDVSMASRGQPVQSENGGLLAPMFTRIVYERQAGYETRQARIWCEFDGAGRVSALLDTPH